MNIYCLDKAAIQSIVNSIQITITECIVKSCITSRKPTSLILTYTEMEMLYNHITLLML